MATVERGTFKVELAGTDISTDISGRVLSVSWTDGIKPKSDEVEISIADYDGKWRGDYYPAKGTQLTLEIGYEGDTMLACGSGEVESCTSSGPPGTFKMKATMRPVSKTMKTVRSTTYENKTLSEIAQEIATRHGLTFTSSVEDVTIGRISQKRENDLTFLRRLARKYGYIVKVATGKLTFYSIDTLVAVESVVVLKPSNVASWDLEGKAHKVHKSCKLKYRDPVSGTTYEHTEDASGIDVGDELVIKRRVESNEQASLVAKAALQRGNRGKVTGRLSLQGDIGYVAGANIELSDFGAYDGKYLIESARHNLDKSGGWKVELEVKNAS